ncbi:MAG: DUF5674 family protein [candidate division KSB1 bacterium]|nr:DUF5674 family protein [candidate division KSB1 bacterium]
MIRIIEKKLSQNELLELCRVHFDTMVKFVIDIQRWKMAVGGELDADGEALLLADGSEHKDLWGGNFYPWAEPDKRIEWTSFVNVRPMDDHPFMEIQNEQVRSKAAEWVERLLLASNEFMEIQS